MIYNKAVEDLFFNTQHAGVLNCAEPFTVCSRIGLEKNKCSELYLACDERGLIAKAVFKAMGDPFLLAGFEWLCRKIEHTPLAAHPCLDYSMIVDALSIPQIRYSAAVLIETSYRQAIDSLGQTYLEKENE